jgi:hypothetical protein
MHRIAIPGDDSGGSILRSIVYDQHLGGRSRLGEDRVQGLGDVALAVADGDDNADRRTILGPAARPRGIANRPRPSQLPEEWESFQVRNSGPRPATGHARGRADRPRLRIGPQFEEVLVSAAGTAARGLIGLNRSAEGT